MQVSVSTRWHIQMWLETRRRGSVYEISSTTTGKISKLTIFNLHVLIKLYVHQYPTTNNFLQLFLALFIRHVWAEKLLAHIMEPRWTVMWMFRIVRGQCTEADYNREMNALFVKIHLLDPQVVIPAFQFLLNQKGTFLNISRIVHWYNMSFDIPQNLALTFRK